MPARARTALSSVIVLLALALLGTAAFGESHPDEREALAFLTRFPHLRLYVAKAPGTGHQASSINILRRVRELGYEGTIEVIYDQEAAPQLAMLLPGFDPLGASRQQLAPDLVVTEREHFKASPHPTRVGLAITGGQDADPEAVVEDLNADLFLRLNPRMWKKPSYLLYSPAGGRLQKRRLEAIEPMYHRPQVARPADVPGFLEAQMHGTPFASKLAGLQTLFAGLKRAGAGPHPEWELAPAYGLNRKGDEVYLRNYVHALRRAFAEHPERFGSRGAIVPVFSEFDATGKDWLAYLIGDLQRDRKPGPQVELHEIASPAEVTTIFDSKPAEPQRPRWSLPWRRPQGPPDSRRIHVVLVGKVPRDVFDYAFSQATLPVLAEGKQTVNLLRVLGIPFLDTYTREHRDTDSAGAIRLNQASNALQRYGVFDQNAGPVVSYLVDAKDPDSEINRYTREVQAQANAVENDILVQALRLTARVSASADPAEELERIGALRDGVCLREYLRLGEAAAVTPAPASLHQ